jgi:DNA excision repair protein ERCC-4
MADGDRRRSPSPLAVADVALADTGPTITGDDPNPGGVMLSFHEQIVDELLERDGLSVLAEGLGLCEVLAGLIASVPQPRRETQTVTRDAFSNLLLPGTSSGKPGHTKTSSSTRNETEIEIETEHGVTLVLGASDAQKRALRVHLSKLAPLVNFPPEITADITGTERHLLYRRGGPLFVTTRIAVVDILGDRLLPKEIAGVVVCNAHRVTDFSGEAFVVRLFRTGNRVGFVRGITDRPGDLSRGFNGTERAMKSLMVRSLNLWPRFHLGVRGCLDKHAPEVVELRQPLTPKVRAIQDAIVEVMHACMNELKKSKHVDVSELTLDKGLHASFDKTLQRQESILFPKSQHCLPIVCP